MNISDVMRPHQSENTRTKRARVLLICGILSSLLSVAMTILARQRKRAPAVAAPSLLDQTLPDKISDAAPYDAIDGYIEQQLKRLNVPGAARRDRRGRSDRTPTRLRPGPSGRHAAIAPDALCPWLRHQVVYRSGGDAAR